jgi:small subunit ribosomal protein S6
VNEYEILLMLDPDLAEERQTEIVARIRGLVEKAGGSWDGHDVWGRRRLAYEIDHKVDGTYHLLHLTCEAETLEEISRVLRIDDAVMRHLATRRIEGGQLQSRPPEPVAAGVAAREDAGATDTEPEPAEEE